LCGGIVLCVSFLFYSDGILCWSCNFRLCSEFRKPFEFFALIAGCYLVFCIGRHYCKTRRFTSVLRILKESDYVRLLLLFGFLLYLHVWLFACARFCIIYYSCIFARVRLFAGSRFEDLLKRLSHIFAVLNVFIENEKEKN
jgi:hypothetical protein